MDLSDSRVLSLLEKALDFRLERQNLLSSNLANVNTPGYRGKDLSFEGQLRSAMEMGDGLPLRRTSPFHLGGGRSLSSVTPEVVVPAYYAIKNDLNSVDMERELLKLSKNSLLYDALVQTISRKMRIIETTIREAGK